MIFDGVDLHKVKKYIKKTQPNQNAIKYNWGHNNID